MGAYNVINPASLVAGQPEDVSVVLANLQAISTILNGGIDNSNISTAAAIAASKLAAYPADGAKVLKGDGTWGAAGAITSIFDVVVGRGQSGDPAAPAATIDSNTILGGNIPATFKHLRLMWSGRSDKAASTSTPVYLKLNNDGTVGNYYDQNSLGNGSGSSAQQDLGANAGWYLGNVTAVSADAGNIGGGSFDFYDYASTTLRKMHTGVSHYMLSTASAAMVVFNHGGHYLSTAALTRIALSASGGNFIAGTRVTLYGLN